MARGVLLSLFTLALLLPVMYRRYQRQSGAPVAGLKTRTGRLIVAGMAATLRTRRFGVATDT